MSKSPNFLIAGAGGAAIVLGGAYGVATNMWASDKLGVMERQIEVARAEAAEATDAASVEAARVAEIEAKAREIQEQARVQLASAGSTSLTAPAPMTSDRYGIGRTALPEEIAAWDVDVLPDGRGLPEGSGNAFDGEEVFVEKCAACHGDFAEGVDNWPVLAGGFDTLADEDPVKTVGSYWPYLSTVWDYVHRSMPFGEAGTLTADETYAIVAYILYSNDMIDEDFELSHETFMDVPMHNAEGFVVDDRSAVEYQAWSDEPCMTACKDAVQVTMRSVFLVNTPPEGGSESIVNPAMDEELPSFTADGASFIPVVAEKPKEDVTQAAVEAAPADDGDALVAAGEKVFGKCKACHQIGAGAKNRSGPILTGVVGGAAGQVDGFKYSKVLIEAAEGGLVWTEDELAAFLAKPKAYLKGTKMSFAGLKSDEDIKAVIAYLQAAE